MNGDPAPAIDGLVGTEAELEATVTDDFTASALGSGDVPVLATPMVLALVERAAVQALAGRLPPALTTVGSAVDLAHAAPTPVGALVRVSARLEEVVDRRLRFTFDVEDEAGPVAHGVHVRVVVERERFVASASRRKRRSRPGRA